MAKTATKHPELDLKAEPVTEPTKKGEVVVHKRGAAAKPEAEMIPLSGDAAILAVIERAARDPSVDIDKFKQLIEISDRIKARAAESEYDQAMAACQAEIAPVTADLKNKQTRSKYPSYPALDAAVRPSYTKHGFHVSFDTETMSPELVRVFCICKHRNGHKTISHIDIPADGKGAKGGDVMTKTHATVSAVTYGKSALLRMLFNIAVGGTQEDDDGNAASLQPISEEQYKKIGEIVAEINDIWKKAKVDMFFDMEKFCAALSVESVADIPAKAFGRAIKELEAFKRKVIAETKTK
jgi:hypothetical protein